MQVQRRGLLMGAGGYALLTSGDAVFKSMTGSWPGPALVSVRFLIGAVLVGLLLAATQGVRGFHVPRWPIQLGRGVALCLAALCFYMSLFFMPLADATAISFASPIAIALLSAWWLGEATPRAGWLAMLVAFAGVLLVLRPNFAGVGAPALLPVAAMMAMSVFVMLNRISAQDVSPLASQFWVAVVAAPLQAGVALAAHTWGGPSFVVAGWPEWSVLARCLIVAVSATGAHMLLFMATRRISAATMAPTSYVQIMVAMSLGIAVFGDWPDALALLGTGLIVVAGLVLWYTNGTKQTDGEELTP